MTLQLWICDKPLMLLFHAVFGFLDLDWHDYVETDRYYYRPAEVEYLLGDASKAREKLGWEPKVNFRDLVRIMTEFYLELAEREAQPRGSSNGEM